MAALLLLVAIAALVWGFGQAKALKAAQARVQELTKRYQPAIDIDQHVRQAKERLEDLFEKERGIRSEINSAQQGLARINEELALASDAAFLVEVGYYEPRYEFEDLPRFEAELQRIREQQKAMLREDGTGNNRSEQQLLLLLN